MDDEWTVPGYTPMRELGVGNGGRVVLAIHDASGVPVAIKYLSDRLFGDKTFLSRFRNEARILAGIRDPHLVRFYEYVESSSAAAIIMELVDGVNLRELLRREGATGPEAALAVLKGSLLGLAAAHAAGVVHRDYKPANVLIDGKGESKLADFGIALPAGHDGNPSGTPAYMAPEQWAGRPATPATDVYAATAVFYECVTGRPPYERETPALLAQAHLNAPIPIKQVPEPLWVMFSHGLAKDPLDRPATAALFLDEVEDAARAAYGPRWESHGRARLAELAALLALLFPLAEPPGRIASVLGLTRLGKDRARTLAAAGAGMAIIMAGAGIAALAADHKIPLPNAIAAPMATPRPLAKDKRATSGDRPVVKPAPSPTWTVPGGLPTGGWTPPGSLPTTPAGNDSPIGGGTSGGSGGGPGSGGGTTPGGGTTQGGGDQTGGGTPGGGTTTPPGGGTTTPPSGGETSSPPSDGGGETTTGGGDPSTPPDNGGETTPPVDQSTSPSPPSSDPSAPAVVASGIG
ncbi:MAG TPA: serine/threonine-protein kinase [Streptosporangiaceae bacterium]